MNDEHIQQLGQLFSHLFPDGADGIVSCGDGWFHIIACLCNNIMNHLHRAAPALFLPWEKVTLPRIEVVQVKEKFGTLRFYTGGYCDDTIYRLISEMEDISAKTCELTGAEGTLHSKGGWLRTLCDAKAAEHGFTKVNKTNDSNNDNNENINKWISLVTNTKT